MTLYECLSPQMSRLWHNFADCLSAPDILEFFFKTISISGPGPALVFRSPVDATFGVLAWSLPEGSWLDTDPVLAPGIVDLRSCSALSVAATVLPPRFVSTEAIALDVVRRITLCLMLGRF